MFARSRLVVPALVAVLLATACGDTFRPPAAVVEGSKITDGDLQRGIPLFQFLASIREQQCGSGQAQHGESPLAACSRFVLTQLITEQIVASYAHEHDVTVTQGETENALASLEQQLGSHDAVEEHLSEFHLAFSDLRNLAQRLLLVQKVARAVADHEVSNGELVKRYRQEQVQFTTLHVAHILVRHRAIAARIAAEATPRNFARLARRYSTDSASASQGGDLGEVVASQLDPTIAQAALSLSPGAISGPVHTQFGWHVIRLISERVTPFPQVRDQILDQFAGSAFTSWLKRQLRSGTVHVNPRYGRLDAGTEQALPVTCTAATPSPSCAAT